MKGSMQKLEIRIRGLKAMLTLGLVAAAATMIACSGNAKPAQKTDHAALEMVKPTVMQSATLKAPDLLPVKETTSKTVKPQPITFRSRDYGVSFVYPWQYAYLSARAVADADSSLKPKPDGHDGQFTLARIEIPGGYYPDTDFQSGYFTLSLNQQLSQEECAATLAGKVETTNINGTDFRWVESESGGGGSAEKVQNYVTFANGTCYEIELGVKTRNNGLAREIDPDQVMRRLAGILATVKIAPAVQKTIESATETVAEMK
jgi:hypothetical protein